MRVPLCLFLTLTVLSVASAQQPSVETQMSAALAHIAGNDLKTREAAFSDLIGLLSKGQHETQKAGHTDLIAGFSTRHPDQADRVKLGLINLLSTENDLFIKGKTVAPGTLTEEDGEYYAQVIDVVSSLDDERAIPALVGAMTTGGMATRGILKYGDKALGPVQEQLKNPDGLVRAVALGLSITLLDRRGDPTARAGIVDLIRSSLTDPEPVVRRHAVREIGCLSNRQDFTPVLEQIAKTDPHKLPGKALDGGDGEEFYPVRYDARRVLRDIQNNKACAR